MSNEKIFPEKASNLEDIHHGDRLDELPGKLQQKAFFDSLHAQFHPRVFARQLASHLFLPLMFFLPNPEAQGVRWSLGNAWLSILDPLMVYAMIAAYFLTTAADQALLGYSVVIPSLLFVMHKTTVSLKYATLSPTEYRRFVACRDLATSDAFMRQMQLFSGWLSLDAALVAFEVSAASARIGVKANEIFLRIGGSKENLSAARQLRYWHAFLSGRETTFDTASNDTSIFSEKDGDDAFDNTQEMKALRPMPDGSYALSVFDLCAAIAHRANKKISTISFIAINLSITLALIALTILPLVLRYNEIEARRAATFFVFAASLELLFYGPLCFGFLYVAIFDVVRFWKMMKTLHSMVRLTDLMMHGSLMVNHSKADDEDEDMSEDRLRALLSICRPIPSPALAQDKQNVFQIELHEERDQYQQIYEDTKAHRSLAMIPRIDVLQRGNATAWIYARLTIQHFGERFRFRTDVYTGFTMSIMLVMMIVAMLSVAFSNDPRESYTTALFLEAIVTITLFIVDFAIITVLGTQVNAQLTAHRRTLSAHTARIKSKLLRFQDCSEQSRHFYNKQQLEAALDAITHADEIASIHNELKPFRVLGLVAHSGLTVSVCTTAVSFYSVIFSFLSSPFALAHP